MASGHQRGEGGEVCAVKFSRCHVTRARCVIVDRQIQSVQCAKLLAILREEVFVAHPLFDVLCRWSKSMGTLCENVALLKQTIDPINSLGIHQIGGVPATGSIKDDVIGSRIASGFGLLQLIRAKQGIDANRCREAKPGGVAKMQKVSAEHGESFSQSADRTRFVFEPMVLNLPQKQDRDAKFDCGSPARSTMTSHQVA